MKNRLYIAFAATLMFFVACTKQTIDSTQPVPDSSRSYIFFEPEVLESVKTKSETELRYVNLSDIGNDAFGVMGYYDGAPLFQHDSYKFSTDARGTGWIARVYPSEGVYSYDYLQPWMSSDEHTFYAFYPYTGMKDNVCIENGSPYILYNSDTDSGIDVLTDALTTTKTATGAARFDLRHRLCALDLKIVNQQAVVNGETTTYPSLVLKKVELDVQIPAGGKIYLADSDDIVLNKTTDDPTKVAYITKTFTLRNESATIAPSTSENNFAVYGPVLFLPGGGLKYRVKITYENALGQDDNFSFPATANTYREADATFVAGSRYTLTINRTADTFVIGSYEDPDGSGSLQAGAWKDVTVPHTFN